MKSVVPKYQTQPAFTIKCQLEGLPHPTPDQEAKFEEIFMGAEELKVKFKSATEPPPVQMWIGEDNIEDQLKVEDLVKVEDLLKVDGIEVVLEPKSEEVKRLMSPEKSESGDSEFLSAESGKEEPDVFEMAKENLEGRAETESTQRSPGQHETSDIVTEDTQRSRKEIMTLSSKYPRIDIIPGQVEEAYPTHADSTQSMYVQLVKQEDKLESFAGEMDTFYRGLSEGELKLEKPEVGEPCAAKFCDEEGNEAWYRGQIVSLEGNVAKVLFVDYGNTESIIVDTIKEISPSHLEHPAYVLHCCLSMELSTEVAARFRDKFLEAEDLKVGYEPHCIIQQGTLVQVQTQIPFKVIHRLPLTTVIKFSHKAIINIIFSIHIYSTRV